MSAKTLSNMWIVIAFMAMAATAAQAAGSNFYAPQQWGGDGVTDQAVDEQYFRRMVEREPGAVIVAAVAANNRERIGGLEGRVGDLEGRVDGHDTELLRQARCNYGGPSYSSPAATQGPSGAGSTTINNNYYGDSPATPSVTPPKPPPSGGDNNKKSKPAKEPEEGRAPVVTFWQVIGGLIVLGRWDTDFTLRSPRRPRPTRIMPRRDASNGKSNRPQQTPARSPSRASPCRCWQQHPRTESTSATKRLFATPPDGRSAGGKVTSTTLVARPPVLAG